MSYLESEEWNVIRKVILKRDAGICRSRYCGNKTDNVIFLDAAETVLKGERPSYLVTFCLDCVAKVRANDSTITLHNKIMEEILGNKIKPGRSNARIGKWYRNNFQMNIHVAEEIKEELSQLRICEIK